MLIDEEPWKGLIRRVTDEQVEMSLMALRLGMFSITSKDDGLDTPEVREWLEDVAAKIRTAHNAAYAIGKFLRWCNEEAP